MQCDGAFISAEVVRQRYVVVVNEYRVHEGLDQALLCLFVRPVSITQAAEIKCDMGFLQVETAGDFPVGNGRLQVGFLLVSSVSIPASMARMRFDMAVSVCASCR